MQQDEDSTNDFINEVAERLLTTAHLDMTPDPVSREEFIARSVRAKMGNFYHAPAGSPEAIEVERLIWMIMKADMDGNPIYDGWEAEVEQREKRIMEEAHTGDSEFAPPTDLEMTISHFVSEIESRCIDRAEVMLERNNGTMTFYCLQRSRRSVAIGRNDRDRFYFRRALVACASDEFTVVVGPERAGIDFDHVACAAEYPVFLVEPGRNGRVLVRKVSDDMVVDILERFKSR